MTESSAALPHVAVWPTLRYEDAGAAIAFLTEGLGFELAARYDDDGIVVHSELRWPEGGGVMLSDARRDGVIQTPPGAGSVYLVVAGNDRVDELLASSTAAGAEVARGIQTEDYGSYGFTVTDAEGTYWSIGTYPGE